MSAEMPYYSKDFATLVKDLLQQVKSPAGGRTPLTDASEGSVVRTLLEAFARELAVCYEQLHQVYRYGYLDTAEGVALDNVVALLGVSRRRAGHIEGSVSFSRQQPAPEDIPIPAGTLVAGRDIPLFETIGVGLLSKGGLETTVDVRSVEPGGDTVPTGAVTVMPRPILGIEGVTNRSALILRQRQEDDEELRERARHILQRANLGTKAALEQAVKALGVSRVAVREEGQQPGQVEVILGDSDISDALLKQAHEAVEKARPAGIQVTVKAIDSIWVQVTATLELNGAYPESQQQRIRDNIEQALARYFASLKIGEPVRWAKVQSILSSPDEVVELHPTPGYNYLTPFKGTPDKLEHVASTHLAANNDIRIGATERALLNPQRLPAQLSLEPPSLAVWVDVEITLTDDQLAAGMEELLRQRLTPALPKTGPVIFQQLADALGTVKFTRLAFKLIHERDGLTVILAGKDDIDRLAEREELRPGRIVVTGGRSG